MKNFKENNIYERKMFSTLYVFIIFFCLKKKNLCHFVLFVILLIPIHWFYLDNITLTFFLIFRIDGDIHNLDWQYTASMYPSFILFPAHRYDGLIPCTYV